MFFRERERESKFQPNTINQGDGLKLLCSLPTNSVKLVFFDPQYEKPQNISRTKNWPLIYQNPTQISQFLKEITRILKPSSFCLLWVNKNLLINNQALNWLFPASCLKIVDLLIWVKPNFGFGSYLRNQAEFAYLLQKEPYNYKEFKDRGFGNVYSEKVKKEHPHQKTPRVN